MFFFAAKHEETNKNTWNRPCVGDRYSEKGTHLGTKHRWVGMFHLQEPIPPDDGWRRRTKLGRTASPAEEHDIAEDWNFHAPHSTDEAKMAIKKASTSYKT